MNSTVLYSFLGGLAAFFGAMLAARQLLSSLKDRAKEEERNSMATEENTSAVRSLTAELRELSRQLQNHEWRIGRLEEGEKKLCRTK